MNQRFQNEDIKRTKEQYADNELYQAIDSIGAQLEAELKEFGLCPEECLIEVLECLCYIADEGSDVLPKIQTLWYSRFNEYRRYDRKIDDDELRKVVGIVFAFVILALDSSNYAFYRYTLTEKLTLVIQEHKFNGWEITLDKIFSVPLRDGWFDDYIINEKKENKDCMSFDEIDSNKLPLTGVLDTKRAQKYFQKAIDKKLLNLDNGKFSWNQIGKNSGKSQLAYFCGKVFRYKHSFNGNAGDRFPEDELNSLFGVNRLYTLLSQVYNVQKPQPWRSKIDELFNNDEDGDV